MPSKVIVKEAKPMANKDAVRKYQAAHDQIKIRPTDEEGAAIRAAAAAAGLSVQAYILQAIRAQMQKDREA
jgi:uncharacterized protein (DUF1778 family)